MSNFEDRIQIDIKPSDLYSQPKQPPILGLRAPMINPQGLPNPSTAQAPSNQQQFQSGNNNHIQPNNYVHHQQAPSHPNFYDPHQNYQNQVAQHNIQQQNSQPSQPIYGSNGGQNPYHGGQHQELEQTAHVPREVHVNPNTFYRTELLTDQQIIEQAQAEKESKLKAKSWQNITKAEMDELMKEILKDLGVVSSWKWVDAHRNMRNDPRFQYLKMSSQDKKQVFTQYLQEVKQEERAQAILNKEKQRDLFMSMLDENKQFLGLNSLSKYYLISKKLASRDYKKFMAVDEQDRIEIFQDYIDEQYRDERDEKVKEQNQQIEDIQSLLKQYTINHEESQSDAGENEQMKITPNTKWGQVNTIMNEEPKWKQAGELERIIAFEEYIKKLDKDDFLARKKERQRIERKRREEYTSLVQELLQSRQFTAQNPWKWSLFVSKYKDDKRYLDLVGQSYPYVSSGQTEFGPYQGSSTPHEIFNDQLDKEFLILKDLKPEFKSLVKGNGIRFSDSSFSTFDSSLSKYEQYQKHSDFEKSLLHEYYLEKLKQKEQEAKAAKSHLIDEIQYQLKKRVDIAVSVEPSSYSEKFNKILYDQKSEIKFQKQEEIDIIQEVITYLQEKQKKQKQKVESSQKPKEDSQSVRKSKKYDRSPGREHSYSSQKRGDRDSDNHSSQRSSHHHRSDRRRHSRERRPRSRSRSAERHYRAHR